MKVLVIDNYDSFIYNLVHYINKVSDDVNIDVYRNDKLKIEDAGNYDKILLSPGPGLPDEAGLMKDIIRSYAESKDILGVCLGHQAIAEVFGGRLVQSERVYHGISSKIQIVEDDRIFKGIRREILVGRYHSWFVEKEDLPECFSITAIEKEEGQIMAIKHKEYNVRGVQFHPESVLTESGIEIIDNWING